MEWTTTKCGKYRIETLSAATFPGALGVIRKAFCEDEAVCIGSEVNLNPGAAEELLELCADAALDGASLVAVETDSGDVVSVAFNKLQVIRKAFCEDEAVCIGSEVNLNPGAAEELLELCADAALDGASLVAVETDSGDVVSVAFNKLQVKSTNTSEKPFFEIFAEERCSYGSSRSLVQFMAEVDGRCNLFDKYGVDCSLEIMFLATLREHRMRKLGTMLSEASIQLARKLKDGSLIEMRLEDLGPKYSSMKPRKITQSHPKIIQAIWTGEATRRIGKSLNFEVHLTAQMKEFVFNGKSYADRLRDEAAFCEVAAIALY